MQGLGNSATGDSWRSDTSRLGGAGGNQAGQYFWFVSFLAFSLSRLSTVICRLSRARALWELSIGGEPSYSRSGSGRHRNFQQYSLGMGFTYNSDAIISGIFAVFVTPRIGALTVPFLDYRANRMFWFSSLPAAAVFTLTGATLILPLYFGVKQLNTSETGIILFINGMGLLLGALAGGVATDRWHSRIPSVFGLSALGLSMFALGVLTSDGGLPVVVAFTMVGFATGMCFAPLSTVITRSFSSQDLSAASGAYNLIRRTGTIMGAVVATIVLDQRLGILSSVLERSSALVLSYRDTFWLLGIIAIVAVFFAFQLTYVTPPRPTRVGMGHGGSDVADW